MYSGGLWSGRSCGGDQLLSQGRLKARWGQVRPGLCGQLKAFGIYTPHRASLTGPEAASLGFVPHRPLWKF